MVKRLQKTDLILIGVVLPAALLAAILTWYLTPEGKTGSPELQPSTFFNVESGAKASYLVLEELGYPVQRLRRPMTEGLNGRQRGLFVLNPLIAINEDEEETLLAWIRAGGKLVLVPRPKSIAQKGSKDLVNNWLQFKPEKKRDVELFAAPNWEKWTSTQPEAQKPSILNGVEELQWEEAPRFVDEQKFAGALKDGKRNDLIVDKKGVVVTNITLGEGEILALTDASLLSNAGLRRSDNGIFLANIAQWMSQSKKGAIAFDEYHLGLGERDSSVYAMMRLLLDGPWGWATAQAAIVAALALLATGKRFGKPRDIIVKPRRLQSEFAESAGRLLQDAGANYFSFRTLIPHLRNRLCQLLFLPSDASDKQIAAAAIERAKLDLAPLLSQVSQIVKQKRLSQRELLDISTEFYKAIEAIENAT